ncbi:hypothetical protein QOT17_020440 [Balamuthia mandrillaris]
MTWHAKWASDPFELQRRLNVAGEAVNALGLQFNAKKSVVLVQGKKAHFQEWRLKGEAVKRVKEAKYLGLWFEERGEWTTHAKERITKAKQALYSLRQRGAIAQGLGTRTAQIAAEAIVKSTLSYGLCMTELSKSWWKKIEAVWNETARSVLQVHRRPVAGVCRAELGWLTIKAYCELERQAVIHHAERQDGHFELLEEVSQASEEEGEKNEGEGGDGTTVVEKKAKRMRALTRVAKMECLVGQQRSLVITNPRKERLMNAIRWGGLPIGKKWGSIQQSEVDSKCPACDAEEETAEHFLLRCPNLWEDRFRIWSVDNGREEQVRKLIIEDCTTKLLSSGKKCNRAQEMEQCKQSCKRVWRLWAARASWKHGSSSAFYQSLEVM